MLSGHFDFGVFEELIDARGIFENIEDLAQPSIVGRFSDGGMGFVSPVGCGADFGGFVHVFGSDLQLYTLLMGADDDGVNGLIAVDFGQGYIIFESPWDVLELLMEYAQSHVAGWDIFDDDSEGEDIGDLFESDMLFLHFGPYGVGGFDSARDGGFDVVFLEQICEGVLNACGA